MIVLLFDMMWAGGMKKKNYLIELVIDIEFVLAGKIEINVGNVGISKDLM